jgi:hypothetical protein
MLGKIKEYAIKTFFPYTHRSSTITVKTASERLKIKKSQIARYLKTWHP